MSGTPTNSRSTERSREASGHQRAEDAVNRLGDWLLSSTETTPGWDRLLAEFKPARRNPGAYHARIAEVRGGRELVGSTGVVGAATTVAPILDELRDASYAPDTGAWLSATVYVDAEGWPKPVHGVGIDLNFDAEPTSWAGEPALTPDDLSGDLKAYPRDDAAVPGWMAERVGDSGHREAAGRVAGRESSPSGDHAAEGAQAGTAHQGAAATERGQTSGDAADVVRAPRPSTPARVSSDSAGENDAPVEPDVVNQHVLRALKHYGRQPEHKTMVNVLRTLMGGEVLLDISGSELKPGPRGEEVGPGSTMFVQTVQGPDGANLLAVYARENTARGLFDATGRDVEFRLQRQPGISLLENFLKDKTCQDIVVEPNGEFSCRIDRSAVEWALATPRLDAAKDALIAESMPQLLGSLLTPGARLLVALDGEDMNAHPVYIQPHDGSAPDTLLLFTSAPEVAAIDPSLTMRAAPALQALQMAVDANAKYVSINALSPAAVLPIDQVKELLNLAVAQQAL